MKCFLGFKEIKRNLKQFFKNIEYLLYSHTIPNLTYLHSNTTFVIESLKSYLQIANSQINNVEFFDHLGTKVVIILNLTNNFILNTFHHDTQIFSQEIFSDIISLKGNILASVFQIFEILKCLGNDENKKLVFLKNWS